MPVAYLKGRYAMIDADVGPQQSLLAFLKMKKLKWYSHVVRHNSMSKSILQGSVEGKRQRGRPRKALLDNIKQWTKLGTATLTQLAIDRSEWQTLTSNITPMSPYDQMVMGLID